MGIRRFVVRYWGFPGVAGLVIFCLTAAERTIGFAGAVILRVDTVTFDFLAPSETRG